MSLHPKTKNYIKRQSQIRLILYFALMSTVFVFGFVVLLQGGKMNTMSGKNKYGVAESDIVYSDDGKSKYGDLDKIEDNRPIDRTLYIFGFMALMMASMSFLLPNFLEKSFKFKDTNPNELKSYLMSQTNPKNGQKIWNEEDISHIDDIPDREKFIYVLAPKLFVINILQWSFSEAVATLGVVAGLQNGFNAYLPFGVGALALLFIHRPDSRSLEKRAAKMATQYWR